MKAGYLGVLVVFCTAAVAVEVAVPQGGANGMVRTANGGDALSVEEAARTYFLEIAYVEANYPSPAVQVSARDMLRDRDGVTGLHADEVIAVAHRLNSPEVKQARLESGRPSMKKLCQNLREARTSEEAKALLAAMETSSAEANRAWGADLLASLSPATRTRLVGVIAEHRKHITVRKRDWRQAKIDEVEAYKLRVCTGIS